MPCGSAKDSNHSDKNGENGHCAFEDLDHSILQHPFNLGSNNVRQILKCMQNASKEVKDLILNECNIIYECKICANLFRSLANFLYHKRCYCKKHLCEDMLLFENFEEETQTVVVQPEPPPDKDPPKSSGESDSLPPMKDCTVKLVKTDIQEKNATAASTEEPKNLRNKGAKAKDQVEDEGKKVAKASKNESPMISRRTREKNSINASKRALRDAVDNEPPKKASKSTSRVNVTSKSSDEAAAKATKVSNEPETESIESLTETKTSKPGKEETSKPGKEETSKFKKEETNKPTKEEASKSRKEETNKPTKEATSKSNKEEASKSGKETKTVMLPPEKEAKKSTSEIVAMSVDGESESDQAGNKEAPKEVECVKSSETPFNNPLKKIIITKPKALDVKNSTVLGNIQKNMKAANKIGFTKITNAAGKSLQCFPKIIFKTIDGNPHAVFQTTEGSKSDSITLKTKLENSVVANKSENEKLIIVLKKEPTTSASADSKAKTVKLCKNQSEFHLTRRKRLLARNDCNVQELRCLTCNTQFTSLKTLYFHMLSIHSKKRLYYPCPFCKTLFVQMYGVTRHLISIHNKTKEQINKLRDVIKKKSIWKKVDDANLPDEIPSPRRIEEVVLKEEPRPESKAEASSSNNGAENSTLKTIIKLNKNMTLHQCSKCGRVFGRKSSQVSHEKFCIMNAIKVETVDLAGGSPISPPPNVSFLSLSPKPAMADPHFHKPVHPIQQSPSDIKINARPKRGAEKQMHKDFVNSQTLKWRSANRVDTNAKAAQSVKKGNPKTLEKKVMNIMNVENLLCMKCNKVFSSFSNLRRHVAIHVGWTRFKCKYCEYQAYNKSQCWAHVQKAHEVSDEDLEKSIVSLSNSSFGRKAASGSQSSLSSKRASDVKVKQIPTKANGIPKVKISRKKVTNNYSRLSSDKKSIPAVKKGNLEKKEENKKVKNQTSDEKKEISYLKKDRNQHVENKKEMNETKKEKNQNLDSKKVSNEAKKEKSQNVDSKKDSETKKEKSQHSENKDASDVKKDKSITLENKIDIQGIKRERTQSIGPVFKCSIPDYKKDASNYKSVTTNNPTTIILSKKFSAPTVQSFVTVSPESLSSTKTFPLRSSPRKIEAKAPEENKMTSLVTRSTAYSKGGPLQVKMSIKSASDEDIKKSVPQSSEKTYAKKDRLISEWFPKKDLNSNSVRRESAPLIIGLVPAANSGSKSPVISYEKNSS
ncbi:hypothetical protein AVEN_269626-1 [Araneus ventricosus]|uniref:C2H2-type domain-containing protein n=1 Tax=Araneus ventricosus TaxID=182803 RepID=A0A4Y2CQR9_ARAVE|nr:hypothetical protein AVEN_269626-1 [Araneus ventricosus]